MRHRGTPVMLLVVLLFFDHVSHAQHWSYGLRPGGKRDPEALQDSYAENPNEVALFTEPQRLECSVPQNRYNLLKGALMDWLDGENTRKKL
ncbi:progonadoliberin-1 [Pelodytes ibericus]